MNNEEIHILKELFVKVEDFVADIETLLGKSKSKRLEGWLTNDEVCRALTITPRTLFEYRKTGVLPYSRLGSKTYYSVKDVQNRLKKLTKNE